MTVGHHNQMSQDNMTVPQDSRGHCPVPRKLQDSMTVEHHNLMVHDKMTVSQDSSGHCPVSFKLRTT